MNPPSRNQRPDSSRQSSRTSGQKTRPNSGNVKKSSSQRSRASSAHSGNRSRSRSAAAHKRRISRKSRYYRQRQKKIFLMTAGAVLLLFLLVISFVIRSCGDKKAESASSQNTQTEGKNNSAKKVSDKDTASVFCGITWYSAGSYLYTGIVHGNSDLIRFGLIRILTI